MKKTFYLTYAYVYMTVGNLPPKLLFLAILTVLNRWLSAPSLKLLKCKFLKSVSQTL